MNPKQFDLINLLSFVIALIGILLLTLPLVALLIQAVMGIGQSGSVMIQMVLKAALLSLGTSLVSMLLVIIIGLALAYIFAFLEFPFKRPLEVLIELPIVMPPVVAGLALLMAFGRRGLLGGPLAWAGITLPFTTAAVVITQVFVALPFFFRSAVVRFQEIPLEVKEAAIIDSASNWQLMWHVILPLSLRALVAGLLLSWARALGEFGATILFAGSLAGRTQTLPLLVYGALERDINAALWSGAILIGMAAVVLWGARELSQFVFDY